MCLVTGRKGKSRSFIQVSIVQIKKSYLISSYSYHHLVAHTEKTSFNHFVHATTTIQILRVRMNIRHRSTGLNFIIHFLPQARLAPQLIKTNELVRNSIVVSSFLLLLQPYFLTKNIALVHAKKSKD